MALEDFSWFNKDEALQNRKRFVEIIALLYLTKQDTI